MDTIEQTRLRFGLFLVVVVAVEAVITAFAPSFPFLAATGIQSTLYITYVTGRTVTDVKVPGV